ncbi:MAG: DUF624 domain-containing protein [Lachnospiraceae bacterium]|nr:DUF624 domain-containing protein [uncultured Acetatifactor sp.]MCI8542507.1 DUF624 domain-containing protein [Lachnospiraceae bacterium]
MKLFNLDSPLMQFLNKVADLMWLNILTLFFCIPIITVGPALTALHYMALKIARDEECYITKDYFKSFKLNLRQGIIIWLFELVVVMLLVGDFFIIRNSTIDFGQPMKIILAVVAVIVLFTFTFVYPVLSKFDNTVMRTIKNAFFIGILQFPKTILMMILSVVPAALFILAPQIIPVVFLFGFSAPAWASAKLYNKFFQKLEDKMNGVDEAEGEEGAENLENPEEDERIFKDELDESIQEEPLRIGEGQD